jgi:hypothetical protein
VSGRRASFAASAFSSDGESSINAWNALEVPRDGLAGWFRRASPT